MIAGILLRRRVSCEMSPRRRSRSAAEIAAIFRNSRLAVTPISPYDGPDSTRAVNKSQEGCSINGRCNIYGMLHRLSSALPRSAVILIIHHYNAIIVINSHSTTIKYCVRVSCERARSFSGLSAPLAYLAIYSAILITTTSRVGERKYLSNYDGAVKSRLVSRSLSRLLFPRRRRRANATSARQSPDPPQSPFLPLQLI